MLGASGTCLAPTEACSSHAEIRTRLSAGGAQTKEKGHPFWMSFSFLRARDGTRTRGLDIGKVALHQLSHSRILTSLSRRALFYQTAILLSRLLFGEQVMGIEPTSPAWKAGVLPLNHTCKVPRAGIEPATRGFSVLCSTN